MNRFRVGRIYEIVGMDTLMHGGNDIFSVEELGNMDKQSKKRGT